MLIRCFKSVSTNLVFRKGGHDQRREDSWSGANAVDDSVQRARVVGSQILRIGQIGSCGSTVEAQDLAQELWSGGDQEKQTPHTAVVEHH